MSTFVYNDGSFESKNKDKLELTFGLFFDGTTNNRYHTEIRKKVEKKGEFADQTASADDRDIYAKYGHNDSFGNDFTNVARKYMCSNEEYAIYVEGIGTVGKEVKKKNDDSTGLRMDEESQGLLLKFVRVV